MTGQAIPVQMHSLETVLHINLQIQKAIGAAPWSQQLFVAGSEDALSWCADVASLNANDALFLVIDPLANEDENVERFEYDLRGYTTWPDPPRCLGSGMLGIPYTKGTHAQRGQGNNFGWCHWRHFELHPQMLGFYRKNWPVCPNLGCDGHGDDDRSGEAPEEILRLQNLDPRCVP
jgi:hypothetical protein